MTRGLAEYRHIAAVPFEAPPLLGTRVRQENSQRVALLHDFARGTGSTYVLSWKDLPKLTPLLGFDANLHQRVGELERISPRSIQKAARKLRGLGAAGPEARAEEIQLRQTEQRRVAKISAILARSLILAIYPDQETTILARGTRASLRHACERCGLRPDSVIDDLRELATIIEPAGLGDPMEEMTTGPLRQLASQIGEVARHCQFRSDRSISDQDDQKFYRFTAGAASAAQLAASRSLNLIDKHLRDPKTTLAQWETRRRLLTTAVAHLEDVLDGWESVLSLHAGLWEAPFTTSITRAASMWALVRDLPGHRHWSPLMETLAVKPRAQNIN